MFFLPNILSVHVRRLGTSVHKSTTKSNLQKLQNRCRSGKTRCSFVIQRRYIREQSHGFCPVASLMHACNHYWSILFWVLAVLAICLLNFLKEPHGPWIPCNHFSDLKCQKTGTRAKATNLIERWMLRCEGTCSNDQCPRLVRLAFLEIAKFRDSFFFPEEEHVENSNWERSSWASGLGFRYLSKKKEEFLDPKVTFHRAQMTAIQPA